MMFSIKQLTQKIKKINDETKVTLDVEVYTHCYFMLP